MKKLHCSLAVLGLLLCACAAPSEQGAFRASSTPPASQWTVRGNLPLQKFLIQCHRGAGEAYPENTIEAFEYAWNLGLVPEADLRTTKDGVLVAFHDKDFSRVVRDVSPELQKKGINDLAFAELSSVDVGRFRGEQFAGQRIPRMSDVFRRMQGRPERMLYLDIKEVDLKQLADEVRSAGVARQVIFTSTHHKLIREWKALVPESQSLNWMGGTEERLKERIETLRAEKFDGITQLQLHVRLNTNSASAEPFNLSRDFIRSVGTELRQHGIVFQSLPWSVYDSQVYWQLLDLGVMSFATDYPEVTLNAVRDYYRGKNKP